MSQPNSASIADSTRELQVDDVTIVEKRPLRRAIAGAALGNMMEWYDFGIYGYLAALMTTIFVPEISEQWRLVVVLLTFAVSFLARPIGGLVFGPLGDRIGRQKTLVITMLTMSIATGLIGMLPSAATIGWWAFISLVVLRLVQGFSTGGEYAGATTFVSEYSPDRRRGHLSSFLDTGSYLGFAFGAAVVALLTAILGQHGMLAWGWRVPFLLALPFGALAIMFRLKIDESPTFESAQEVTQAAQGSDALDESQGQLGVGGLVRHHWRPLLIAMALVGATNTAGYSLTSYMPSYLESNHGYSTLTAALSTIPALVAMSIAIPFVGKLSDRVGRRPIYAVAVLSTILFTLPAFMLMEHRKLVFVAMLMLAFSVTCYVSVAASTLPALFPTASRFGGMALSYNVAASLFGGTAPAIGETLVKWTGYKNAPALYIIFFSVLGGIALLAMKETARKPLPGSMPAVASVDEAEELVATQHENPDLEHEELPFDAVDAAREASASDDADPAGPTS